MKFKEMAREMSDVEVERCMSILIEDSVVLGINRDIKGNTIEVIYRVIGDDRKERYILTLMSDEVQDMENIDNLRPNGEYFYRQYLVAKGYSEFWKGNMFVEE